MADITIHGVDELVRKLKRMPINVRKKYLGKAMREAGKVVRDSARELVPVADQTYYIQRKGGPRWEIPPGNIKRHIAYRGYSGRRAGGNAFRVGVGVTEEKPSKQYYWRFIELEAGNSTAPAKPFLRPALENNSAKVIGIITERLRRDITNEAIKK